MDSRHQAVKMRQELLKAARKRSILTYGHLMTVCRLSRGPRFSQVLGVVDAEENSRGAPGFAAMVARKDTLYPGGGYFCDDSLPPVLRRPLSRRNDPKLSVAEKDHIRRRRLAIWKYYASVIA